MSGDPALAAERLAPPTPGQLRRLLLELIELAAGDGVRYPPGFRCMRMNSMSFLITPLGS